MKKIKTSRIALFASGDGTNAEAIMNYFESHPSIEVSMLLSNNPAAYALVRAKNHFIPTRVFDREQLANGQVAQWLEDARVTHVVLAGFLWLVPASLIDVFSDRIINIHPALLPKFSGRGMYGINVHRAVKVSGDSVTGITIHVVNRNYDEGKVLFQATCAIADSDSPQQIADKVHQLEYVHYPRVIEQWVAGGLLASSF